MTRILLGVRVFAAILPFALFSTALRAESYGPLSPDVTQLLRDMAEDPDKYTIGEIEVVGETDGVFSLDAPLAPIVTQRPPRTTQMPGGSGFGEIQNYFNWAWQLIQSNVAVLNVDHPPFASALPGGLTDFTQMEWPNPPIAREFNVVIKNVIGMKMVQAWYFVQATCEGRYEGRGQYLNNVEIVPGDVIAEWGFKVNVSVQIANVLNFGTKEDPIGGVQMILHVDSKALNAQHIARSYVVRGDSRIEEVRPNAYVAMAW